MDAVNNAEYMDPDAEYMDPDPHYAEIVARAFSKPVRIPNSPGRRMRCHRWKIEPIEDPDVDDECILHMDLPEDHDIFSSDSEASFSIKELRMRYEKENEKK